MYHRVRLPLTVVLLGAMLAGASAFAQAPAAPVLSNPIVNGRGVVLQWTDPSPNTATGVRIEAGSASGLSDLAVMDFPYWVTGHAIEPVPPGRYYVRVRARSAGGWGPSSNEQIVPVAGCPEPPAVPHFGANVAGQRVQLVISPDQTGCAPTSHIIEVGRSRGQTDILQAPLAGLVATFDSVPAGTYFVRVVGGFAGATNPDYTLTIDAPDLAPDRFEPNDDFPQAADLRTVAGAPITSDVTCQRRPPRPDDYRVTFTSEQWARLLEVFPDGVCDWSRRGIGQVRLAGTWQSYD